MKKFMIIAVAVLALFTIGCETAPTVKATLAQAECGDGGKIYAVPNTSRFLCQMSDGAVRGFKIRMNGTIADHRDIFPPLDQ